MDCDILTGVHHVLVMLELVVVISRVQGAVAGIRRKGLSDGLTLTRWRNAIFRVAGATPAKYQDQRCLVLTNSASFVVLKG